MNCGSSVSKLKNVRLSSVALALVIAGTTSCKTRTFQEGKVKNATSADQVSSNQLRVNPLDLSFHFPFPSENEPLKLKVSEELIPREYFDKTFPNRWFAYHAWLFDSTLKSELTALDTLAEERKEKPDEIEKREKRLVELTQQKDKLENEILNESNPAKPKLMALKEKVWNHLYVTGVRFEPCFPALPTADQKKDFLKCGLHAMFLVAQVIVDGRAYGTANTLNTQSKENVVKALQDFAKLREISGVETKEAPIYIHPGFSGSNATAFFAQTKTVFAKYFGAPTLFGCAFSAKSTKWSKGYKKEIWNLNANAAPIKFSLVDRQKEPNKLPVYGLSTDQMLIIDTRMDNGHSEASIGLNPPNVGPLPTSAWETTYGAGLEKDTNLRGIQEMAQLPGDFPGQFTSTEMLAHSHKMDNPAVIAINKENCSSCHLSSAVRYRKMPNSKSPKFVYDEPGAATPATFRSAEEAMHPDILKAFKEQEQNHQWLPYHHGYAFGTNMPIVSARHIYEMFAVTQMVNLKGLPVTGGLPK